MGKFVYKIIRFLLMLPINLIKYFCLGFYFSCSVLIEIMLYAIYFASFLVYKSVKYLVLSFSFPILIFNLFRRVIKENKTSKKIEPEEEIIMIPSEEDNNIIEPIVLTEIEEEPLFIEDNVADIEDINDLPIIIEEDNLVEDIKTELAPEILNIDKPKKVKVPRKKINVMRYLFLPFEIISYPVYKTFKYIVFGCLYIGMLLYKTVKYIIFGFLYSWILLYKMCRRILFGIVFVSVGLWTLLKYIAYLCEKVLFGVIYTSFGLYKACKYTLYGFKRCIILMSKAFICISFFTYKIFKYLLYSFGFPVLITNIILTKNRDRINKYILHREQQKLKRQEDKFKKQLEAQRKQEEKLREKINKKNKNEYINEQVKVEKATLKEQFDKFLNDLFSLPTVFVKKIKDSINNSVFMKNKRNQMDINRQALLIDFEGEGAQKSDVKLIYQYTAKNKDGKVVTDYMEAFSKVEVHSFLLSEGYEVYNIKTNKWIQLLHQNASDSKVKMKTKDLIFFLTQLSTYIKAGIPLVDSLKILARQYGKNKRYQRLFKTIIYDLSMGDSFSTALGKQGDAFPRILINMVKASEMTGELPEVLDDMADYFTEIDKTRKQMVTALMYPLIILVISIAVVVFILLFVIPKFVDIYQSMDASKIPAFTLAVLAVSNFLKSYSIYLLIALVVIAVLLVYLYRNVKVFRTLCQWLFMHTPVLKDVIIYNEVTTFTKTFASLLSHNVYITDSMEILTRITNNEIYKMLILDTITNLAKGEKISTSFNNHWAFPLPAYEMLVTGEQTGQLPEMMAKVSDYYQDLHKNTVTRIKTFVEPILIIFLTVVVGAIVLSIIIPMFGMYQTVQDYS